MSRKRTHESNAEKQKAYRRRNGITERTKREKSDPLDKWRSRSFVALDGEGKDDATGTHHYTMLTASDGKRHYTIQSNALSTQECFDFLLAIHKDNKSATFVGFSFNYDINMMLSDVPIDCLKELIKDGFTYWNGYGISWIPGKIFRISTYAGAKLRKDGRGKKPSQTITIYDVFGFFQASFYSTLNAWDIGTIEQRTYILNLKKQRGQFAEVTDKTIAEYNTLECVLLVDLMNALRNALDTAGLYIKSWHGAGAISGELLRLHKIDEYIQKPDDETLNNAIMSAYFGGRFQTCILGEFEQSFSHDLKSAYPSAFLPLPSLIGEWRGVNEYQEDSPWSIYRVSWELPFDTAINPFPHRYKRRISYPYSGVGWYWYPEVTAALRAYGPERIRVETGYVFSPLRAEKPFSFLQTVYDERKRFASMGNAAEKVLKLGINGVYGKTAQGTIGEKPPRYQSYIWAGYCTSTCRARVFELAMRNPDAVIAFATDGVFATKQLTYKADEGNGLGEWESGDAGYLFWAQSGVYFGVTPGTKRISKRVYRKTRGLGRNEVNFARLRKQWRDIDKRAFASQTIKIRRFFGLQYCLHTNDMSKWRNWIEITKEVTLTPAPQYISLPRTGKKKRLDIYNLRYRQCGYRGGMSEPYVEKGKKREIDDDDLRELYLELDQPHYQE